MFNFFKKCEYKNENLFKVVVESTRSSLDIRIVKQKIVDVVGKALNADRCFILEYDKINDKFLKINEEYLSTSEIPSYIDIDLNDNIPKFALEFKKGKTFLLNKSKAFLNGEEIDLDDGSFEAEKIAIEYFKVDSALVFPIYYIDDFLGDLVLHYVKKNREIQEDEINLLKDIANQIAIALHQANLYKLVKKNSEKETVLRKLIEAIRTTINLDETKQIIVKTIGETLNADRCFITDYDQSTNRFLPIKDEYLSSEGIISVIGQDVHEIVPKFIEAIKNGKYLLVKNKEIFLDTEKQNFTIEQETFEKYGVNSTFAVPLFYQNKFLGVLSIHYVNASHEIGEFEVNLMKEVANQVAIAIHQANLYKAIKKQAERENLIFNVTEKIRASLDLDEILSFICREIVKIFDVQRAAITSFIDSNNYEDYIIRKEYKLSPEIRGYSNDDDFQVAVNYLTQNILVNGIIAFDNIEKSNTPDIFRKTYTDMGIKSFLGICIRKDKNIWGILALSEYNNYRNWSDEEKNLLAIISNQIYIAIHQAELYQTVQNTAKNEKILRDIMLSFVKTLEMGDLIKNIVTQTGQLFKADRCFFIGSDSETNSNLPVKEYAEYLSSPDIKSHTQRAPLPSETSFFVQLSKQQKAIFANVDKVDLPESTRKFLDDLSVKSYLIAPVYYGEIRYGAIVLHYVTETKTFTDEDINIILAIANQAAIVIHQAELYLKIKRQSEKEKLLREITESIRSSIDIYKTKQSIVNTIGKTLNADRCFIVEYDKTNDVFINVEYEYLSSKDIISFVGVNPQIEFPVFANSLKNGKTLLIQNGAIILESENQDFSVEEQSLQKYGLNSGYALPLYYKDEPLGLIAVHYVKEKRLVAEDEIDLLHTISSQIAIALYQSKLYNTTLIYAERERISKNIIEILRSSIDKTIIKKLFVKNIGKFLDADRVFLIEYDSNEKKFMPIDKDSEYLSSLNEKSFVGINWSQNCIREYYQAVQDKREVKIFSIDEYIKGKELECDIKNLLEEAKIKSSYSFPVFYQDKLIGSFCIDFTQQNTRLSDEDINRIRNMCTQAGIALYHAELYEKAQECFQGRKSIISEYLEKIKNPTQDILDTSTLLSQNEFVRTVQIEYLNKIINACNTLLELTKGIS